jgi:hypothetical protein
MQGNSRTLKTSFFASKPNPKMTCYRIAETARRTQWQCATKIENGLEHEGKDCRDAWTEETNGPIFRGNSAPRNHSWFAGMRTILLFDFVEAAAQ